MKTILKTRLGQFGIGALAVALVVLSLTTARASWGHGPSGEAVIARGSTEAELARQNILSVLRADERLGKQLDGSVPQGSSPSMIVTCVARYCAELESLDMSDCPADFRVAYREHMRAWRQMEGAIREIPDSFLEGVWQGFLNGLSGESDGGASRLRGDLRNAINGVTSTWNNVEQVGAKYGAAL